MKELTDEIKADLVEGTINSFDFDKAWEIARFVNLPSNQSDKDGNLIPFKSKSELIEHARNLAIRLVEEYQHDSPEERNKKSYIAYDIAFTLYLTESLLHTDLGFTLELDFIPLRSNSHTNSECIGNYDPKNARSNFIFQWDSNDNTGFITLAVGEFGYHEVSPVTIGFPVSRKLPELTDQAYAIEGVKKLMMEDIKRCKGLDVRLVNVVTRK